MAKIQKVLYTPQEEQKSFLQKTSDFLGMTPLANRIAGKIFSGTEDYQKLGETLQAGKEIEQRTIEQIQKNKLIGKDTTKLEQALKSLQISNKQTEDQYKGLATGGVTNQQVLGSALQTASWVPGIGAIGKVIAGASKVGKATAAGKAIQGLATPLGQAAIEGGISGALGASGSYLQSDPRATVGGTLASAATGGIVGGALGAGVSAVAPAIGKSIGGAFARFGSPREARIAADAVAEITKSMPPSGKKTVGSFIREYTSAESADRFKALQALYERNNGKTVKTFDGLDVDFDPMDVKFETMPFAFKQATDSLSDDMLERLSQVSNAGMRIDTGPVIRSLRKELSNAVTKEKKAIIQRYIDDFDGVTDPLSIRSGLQEIGSKVGSYMQTGANKTEGTIATKVYKELETTLNNFFAEQQAPIKELYDQYSALKKIEFDITKAISKQLRESGNYSVGNAVDDYGLSLIGSGIAYGSPMQVAKGGFLTAIKGIQKMLGDPERALRNAFKKTDEWYKMKGINSVIPNSNFEGAQFQAGINKTMGNVSAPALPEGNLKPGQVQYGQGVRNPDAIPVAPRGSASEIVSPVGVGGNAVPAAPRSKPNQAQINRAQTMQEPYLTPEQMPTIEMGTVPKSVSDIPDIDKMPKAVREMITKLPENQQEQAKMLYKEILERGQEFEQLLTGGQKKNLKRGFSTLQAALSAAGIAGASKIFVDAMSKPEYFNASDYREEVSPAKEEPVKESIVEKYSGIKEKVRYPGQFTMYNPEEAQTDSTPDILASGKKVKDAIKEAKENGYDGIIAAGFRPMPLGTIVYVPELDKTFVVEDRMNKKFNIKNDYRFDLISDSKEEAVNFGRQDLTFEVIGHDGRESTKIDTSILRDK